MKNFIFLMFFLFVGLTKVDWALSATPSLDFIIKKSVSTTGRQVVSYEQDLLFKVGSEEAVMSESWLVEGDRNLKLSAQGRGLFKDNVSLNFLYNNKNRTSLVGKNKLTEKTSDEFYERYFFIRSIDSFKNYMHDLGVVTSVRLSRAADKVTFALGQPSDQNAYPQIWIDQDDFTVRQLRLPTGSLVTVKDLATSVNDLLIGKVKIVRWLGADGKTNEVQIKIKSVSSKKGTDFSTFYPQNLSQPSSITFANQTPLTSQIEEFYRRFR